MNRLALLAAMLAFPALVSAQEPSVHGDLRRMMHARDTAGFGVTAGQRSEFVDAERRRYGHTEAVGFAEGTSLLLPVAAAGPATHGHGQHGSYDGRSASVVQAGQSAFAAIQEIVGLLAADPRTDWTRVDIEALRRHLIDMDNVTLRARVAATTADGSTRFEATSGDPAVTASIRAMLSAHAAAMDGAEGWSMRAEEIVDGAALTVSGGDQVRVRALGLLGILVTGMHHQAHHLAIATGRNPHAH